MKKRLLCLLLTVIFSLSAFVSCKKADNIDTPYGMKLASDPSVVDYYLFVPTDWTIELSTGGTSAYYSTDDPSSVTVAVYGLSKDINDAQSYWEFFAQQFENVFGDPTDTEESNLLLDGKEAMQYVFAAELGTTAYKFRQIVCTRNGMSYILTYASTIENFDRHADEVQEIVAQFKFMV